MKKKNTLLALKNVITSIYGRSPENRIMHCNIEKNGTNGRKVPSSIRTLEESVIYQPKTNNNHKSLSKKQHPRRGKIEKNISNY